MGFFRATFYRHQELGQEGGVDLLINRSKCTPNVKNRAGSATEQAILDYTLEQLAQGQHHTSNELCEIGVFVSGSGVCCIWLRLGFESFKKRLQALEEKLATEDILLNDSQIAALDFKKD